MLHALRVELLEVLEQGERCLGRYEPFCCSVVEVLQDDVDADQLPRPAEAVEEVGRHACGVDREVLRNAIERLSDRVLQRSPPRGASGAVSGRWDLRNRSRRREGLLYRSRPLARAVGNVV